MSIFKYLDALSTGVMLPQKVENRLCQQVTINYDSGLCSAKGHTQTYRIFFTAKFNKGTSAGDTVRE